MDNVVESTLQQFEIQLNSGHYEYRSGEPIAGLMKITNEEVIQHEALIVNCSVICGLTTKRLSYKHISFEKEVQLYHSSYCTAPEGTLEIGSHTLPFEFIIPASVPTSFFGAHGHIEVRIHAQITTPSSSRNVALKVNPLFLNEVNLNDVPGIQEINCSSVTKDFTYMLVKNGTIVLKATTDLRGYTPLQVINLDIEIKNQSGKSTSSVVASFIQTIVYETQQPIHEQRTIAEIRGTRVRANTNATWKEQFMVPPLVQSTLTLQDLIRVEYYIQVSIKSPAVLLKLPIVIGHVKVSRTNDVSPQSEQTLPLTTPTAGPKATASPSKGGGNTVGLFDCWATTKDTIAKLEEALKEDEQPRATITEEITTKSHSQPRAQRPGEDFTDSPHSFKRIWDLQTYGPADNPMTLSMLPVAAPSNNIDQELKGKE